MITKYEYMGLTWVDIESPNQDEIRELMKEYSIHPFVAEELLLPTVKPRVELYDDYIYLILHFPTTKHHHSKSMPQEIDFIIGKKFIITTRYDAVDPVHNFSKTFEVNSVLEKGEMGGHAGFIFYHMINKIYKFVSDEIDYNSSKLKKIEDDIFKGMEKEMVREISETGRILLDFKQIMAPHDEILKSFEEVALNFFGKNFAYPIKSIMSEQYKIIKNIEKNKETLDELRETNNSLLSTKQNEIMTVLTVVSFIAYPITIITALFQMNTKYTPIIGMQNDFWIVAGTILVVAIGLFIYFKSKKWL
ncbi:MAG: magnesium transporter [Parcubacteria group bacterium Athens0714_16]|nr:MAG: magnesium transporter [Parcubacteria group bacterium Athens0714_16]